MADTYEDGWNAARDIANRKGSVPPYCAPVSPPKKVVAKKVAAKKKATKKKVSKKR